MATADGELYFGRRDNNAWNNSEAYEGGRVYTIDVAGDETDIYVPTVEADTRLSAAIMMQGARVDKRQYSNMLASISTYGFVVAVPNHRRPLLGRNMTKQKVFNRVWAYLQQQEENPASPLFGVLDTEQVSLMGHSLGGIASLNILQNKCRLPTCIGVRYRAPEELTSVVLFGTNTAAPVSGRYSDVNTRGIPIIFIQGEIDGMAELEETQETFSNRTEGLPRVMVTIRGANHYGLTNENNPKDAIEDQHTPTITQADAIETHARWSGLFMRAWVYDDQEAADYIFQGIGAAEDTNVVAIEALLP